MSRPPGMAAPAIPNLLSLRGTSGGGRGRGRNRGSGRGGHSNAASSQAQHDATIQGTDTDAAMSRLSAVQLGYLDDPFAPYFVQGQGISRRLPLINRGTYTRTKALDAIIDAFLGGEDERHETASARQIISLGAGTDTRCFRLFSQTNRQRPLIYHEIDFAPISLRKRMTVQATPVLRNILPEPTPCEDPSNSDSWRSYPEGAGNEYWCHGLDLRDLTPMAPVPEGGADKLSPKQLSGLRTDTPTLLISECCLCYLETNKAEEVIEHFTSRISNLGLVLYEPIKPDDAFGKQMVSNLAARRITMPTVVTYKEPADQEKRLRQAGFEEVRQTSINEVWENWIPYEEKERVDALEGLDEVEEWQLLAGHYIVVWGWRGDGFDGCKTPPGAFSNS